jgi:hypothetical protein
MEDKVREWTRGNTNGHEEKIRAKGKRQEKEEIN